MINSFDDPPPVCEICSATLTMHHDVAGRHLAVRLDCPEHGPQLMWAPFSDDRESSE